MRNMNKIRLGRAIWSSFCLQLTWNYDGEVEKTCLKWNYWKYSLNKLENHLLIITSIMDEQHKFQKHAICIHTALSVQALFQHGIRMWAGITSYTMKSWGKFSYVLFIRTCRCNPTWYSTDTLVGSSNSKFLKKNKHATSIFPLFL